MNLPDIQRPFARTNLQTIHQRAGILKELLPGIASLAEICCGDCQQQFDIYRTRLGVQRFCGLDYSQEVVELNHQRKIPCVRGDALDQAVMRSFLDFEAVFFGPPLSADCDGHNLLAFRDVIPGFMPFTQLFLQELDYQGLLVLICPRGTTLGDVQWLIHQIAQVRSDYGLRLLHYSYATLTGLGEATELRLKYVELWLQKDPATQWEIRESKA
jgi:hypothetical protein